LGRVRPRHFDPSDVFSDENADYVSEFDGISGERRFNMNPYPTSTTNQQVSGSGELTSKKVIKKTETPEDSSIGLDWDENWSTRFWKKVVDDKRALADERRKLEHYGANLAQEKNNLEEQKMALETREAKISEIKDLIPSAQQLKEMGALFSQVQAQPSCSNFNSENFGWLDIIIRNHLYFFAIIDNRLRPVGSFLSYFTSPEKESIFL